MTTKTRSWIGVALAGVVAVGSATWLLAQAPVAPPQGGRGAAPVPPKPISEEFLLLGDETRGSGEAQFVIDPTDANNIIGTGMGTWQAIPGCEAPNVNCKDFHNFPNSTWPVSAQSFDGGRTWKHFVLPILEGKRTRCPDPFAGATKDGIMLIGCEPRETDPVAIDPPGGTALLRSEDHGKTWSKRIEGISSYTPNGKYRTDLNIKSFPQFAPDLKPYFGGNSPWDRPWLTFDDKTGTIYLTSSGGQTNIDTGAPDKLRTQSYFTVSKDKAKSFGTVYALDSLDWPQSGRVSAAAGLGSFAEIYVASKVPASEGVSCPCQVFGISYDEGKTWTRHVMKHIVIPAAAPGARAGGGGGGGGGVSNLIADPTTPGRFSVMRTVQGAAPHYEISTSNDDGKTWSPFVSVGTVPEATSVTKPAIMYSRFGGVIGLTWKAVYTGGSFDVWSVISKDAGKTFSAPLRVSHEKSPARDYYRNSQQDDNDGIDMTKDMLMTIWGDSRAGFQASWFGKVALSSYQFGTR
ncbi:MAG: exo-alpha-sialidase [Acidobacteria bacterium]|nr:exo-alpha-sialidase [Acidobacteriota bacterium]